MKWIFKQAQGRLKIIIICFVLYGLAIMIRLFYVQIVQHEELTELAKANWDREIPFQEERGDITDRHGEAIVTNKLAPTLYFMKAQNENVEEVADQLWSVLQTDREKLLEKLSKRAYLTKLAPEGKNITAEQAEKVQQMQIDGLYSGVDYVRHYPYGTLLSRLLGFTGYDSQGLAGIEYEYNDVLTGDASAIRLFTDAKGNAMRQTPDEWRQGEGGSTIELTVDIKLQQVVERELAQAMEKYNAEQALALAMNPKTGEILAISSYPTYDPTDYQKVDQSIYNRNLPVFMTFEPGSTFKIITLSAAIEEDVVDLENESFHDQGFTMVEGARLRCWKREGHGHQTFLEVVENSCNPGFIEMGNRIGSDKLLDYIHKFGFGEKTGSNLAGEASGILFSKEGFGPVESATTAFGQGVSVTPIQQVQAVAAAINGGTLYTPYIISRVVGSNGKVLVDNKPAAKRQVISEETSKKVREALESVVANGSGKRAYRDGLRIGGKTGTAQKVENGRYKDGEYIVSFIGFAPANDPELLVYVAVDSPKAQTSIFGSTVTAPIVGQIIEEGASILDLPYSSDQLPKKYAWGDEITEAMPDFIGQKREEMMEQQYTYRIEWHGEGEKIIDQLPVAGKQIGQDEIIHLYLGN
ncbi:penicillin-binding transpeptidase domain-containing protein [Lysinibacillus sp. 3P01SB]|uniref:penicillin-binding transpeptidase domain-containing protein n=1 Tax=Lysinibacillus sp. 3P01SB TaxID=3132284 RepID=UPI0039A5D372